MQWSNPFDPEKMAYLTQEDTDNFSLLPSGGREVDNTSHTQTRLHNRQAIQETWGIPAPRKLSPSDEIAYYRSMLTHPQYHHVNLGVYINYLSTLPGGIV